MKCVRTKWQDTDQNGKTICEGLTRDKRLTVPFVEIMRMHLNAWRWECEGGFVIIIMSESNGTALVRLVFFFCSNPVITVKQFIITVSDIVSVQCHYFCPMSWGSHFRIATPFWKLNLNWQEAFQLKQRQSEHAKVKFLFFFLCAGTISQYIIFRPVFMTGSRPWTFA